MGSTDPMGRFCMVEQQVKGNGGGLGAPIPNEMMLLELKKKKNHSKC